MWKSFITILCVSGTVLAYHEPQSVLMQRSSKNCSRTGRSAEIMRSYTCPDGFVRLRRNCFYFSGGTANWQEAHFFCKDRNATLATLTKKFMDRQLRKFLIGPQMKQLERWIGARYNWGTAVWEWGVTGENITYDGFSKLRSGNDQLYQWQCAIMNPERKFHWAARSCFEKKHYVCQTPAVGIEKICQGFLQNGKRKRGSKRVKSLPQSNGTSTRNMIDNNEISQYTSGRRRSTRRPRRPMWGNGMRLGMRPPPKSTRWAPGAKYSDRLKFGKGQGFNEADQWVSPSKVATMIQSHPDSKPGVELAENSLGGSLTGPKSLSAGPDTTFSQYPSQLDDYSSKVLFGV